MTIPVQLIIRVYSTLVRLYPQCFRDEFEEETQAVFAVMVTEAAKHGPTLATVCLRELRDLPGAVIREHRHERKKRNMEAKLNTPPPFKLGSWREALAAMAPFLLWTIGVLLPDFDAMLPKWLESVLAGSWLAVILILPIIVGLVKGLPRWSLPPIGLALAFLILLGRINWLDRLLHRLISSLAPWFLRAATSQGIIWFGLLVVVAITVLMVRAWRPLHPFYQRIRGDWTLLSFGLYGATLLALPQTFDDYVNEEPYEIMAALLLVTGGWLYLRSPHLWQRALSLFGGITSAMAVTTLAKVLLHPGMIARHRYWGTTWQREALVTIILWGWMVVAIFAPILLRLLPRTDAGLLQTG